MTIKLPPEIEGPLHEQAQLRGTTPELLALDILRAQISPANLDHSNMATCNSLIDWLGPFVGILHSSEHIEGGAF